MGMGECRQGFSELHMSGVQALSSATRLRSFDLTFKQYKAKRSQPRCTRQCLRLIAVLHQVFI